ncbi:MAG: hypothetical protein MJ252_17165 [archaeon]|nr:hypothetical protein [archaeon]
MENIKNEISRQGKKIKNLEEEVNKLSQSESFNKKIFYSYTEPKEIKKFSKFETFNTLNNIKNKINLSNSCVNNLKEENNYLRKILSEKQKVLEEFNKITQEAILKLGEFLKLQNEVLKENTFLKNKIAELENDILVNLILIIE